MRTLALTALAGATFTDLLFGVDEQQFHHQYTRVAMIMVMGLVGCGALAVCGAIVLLLRR